MVPRTMMETITYAPYDSNGCLNTGVKFSAGLPASYPDFLNAHNQSASNIPFEFDL